MPNTAIKFENISKQYRLGKIGTGTLSHDLNRWWTMNIRGKEDPYLKIGQVNDRAAKASGDFVWALKDINLEVKQGEVLGIIGKNGAGKSTLLKILSRVTTPTTGRITAFGRIASLLEVGTGFHPEMTGRENIFMNGSIMGMSKAEIKRKFDEIVDFAGIEKYIDTPVKRYSSGMTVRLGFAIAAHLEPEILVVDEVLAVGDAEFQKKAIGKMQDVSTQEGRTVLFVSHNMGAVERLCNSCLWLQNGLIVSQYKDVKKAIKDYTDEPRDNKNFQRFKLIKTNNFTLIDFGSRDAITKEKTSIFTKSDKIELYFELDEVNNAQNLSIGYAIYKEGVDVPLWWSFHVDREINILNETIKTLFTSIPSGCLNDGRYKIEVLAALHNQSWILSPGMYTSTFSFEITGGAIGSDLLASTTRPTILMPVFQWNFNFYK
jgi:lipopolysaccharide transport system ATP-binding protein